MADQQNLLLFYSWIKSPKRQ